MTAGPPATASERALVSVVVCTHDRPHTLRRALASVLAQDFPDVEVLVVDDGSDPPVTLDDFEDPRVRVLRQDRRGVGAARATGLAAATGAYVAYCDDDDEWLPGRLRTLYDYLVSHPDVALVYGHPQWEEDDGRLVSAKGIGYSSYLLAWENSISPTDVLHRAGAARDAGGFDASLPMFEDWDLWLRMSRRGAFRYVAQTISTCRWHDGMVASSWDDRSWRKVYDRHQSWLGEQEPPASHAIRVGAAAVRPFDPSTWTSETRQLVWHSMLEGGFGYAIAARSLVSAVDRAGVDVTMAPTLDQPPLDLEGLFRPLDHWGRFAFYYDVRLRPSALPSPRVVNYSMWETTRPPEWHIDEINRAVELQYVPSRDVADIFREAGCTVPIKVLHHGVDAEAFPVQERRVHDTFVFGTVGDLSPRKGIDVLLRAFEDEFDPREPVRMVLKGQPSSDSYESRDPRVEFVTGVLSRPSIASLMHRMHAFVMPSRGEGFGLCGLEAMSTGLPVIATNWSGPAEYMRDEYAFPLEYRRVATGGVRANHVDYRGEWAEPDYEHLRSLMRWVYEHPDEAFAKGRRAAEVVRERWTWDRVAAQLVDDLDELAS